MFTKRLRLPALVLALVAAAIPLVQPAQAYTLLGCKWGSGTIVWTNAASSGYKATMTAAASAWTAAGIDANYGAVSWDGLTISTCVNGKFTGSSAARINTFYADAYTANGRKQVMVHELGHVFGLDENHSPACSGQPIMYYHSNRYTLCAHVNPQADDVSGVNFLY